MSQAKSRLPIPVWRKALYALLVLSVVVAALEVTFRAAGIGERPRVVDYIADWEIQWKDDFYVAEALPDSGINRDGVRDYDHHLPKPEGRIRIVCLGDSVTYGFVLEYEDSYPAILEKKLRDLGHDVEVFNVALPGWATRQQRIAYHRIARKYQPDYVILGFCLNDVAEMQNNLKRPPYVVAQLYKHSQVFRSLMRPESREIGRVEELFQSPSPQHVSRGWALCHDEILQLARDVEQDDARFALLVLPFRFQVKSNAPPPTAQQKLNEFAAQHRLQAVDVLDSFVKLGKKAFVDHDHLSRVGAGAVAEELIGSGVLKFCQPDADEEETSQSSSSSR